MKKGSYLAVPFALALAACNTMEPGGFGTLSFRPDPNSYCTDDKGTVIKCELTATVRGHTVTFMPTELHVHKGSAYIWWIVPEGYEFIPARRDGVFFKNTDEDGGPFEGGFAVHRGTVLAVPKAEAYLWFDNNQRAGKYEFGAVVRETKSGTTLPPVDPPVINHGNS